jgi:cytochrome c-type biogenesis protein CcmH/NrfG
MEADERTHRLLEEIRDAQREHLAEYRRVTDQTLEIQRRIVTRQEQVGHLYKRVVLVAGLLVASLLGLLLYVLVRRADVLFR